MMIPNTAILFCNPNEPIAHLFLFRMSQGRFSPHSNNHACTFELFSLPHPTRCPPKPIHFCHSLRHCCLYFLIVFAFLLLPPFLSYCIVISSHKRFLYSFDSCILSHPFVLYLSPSFSFFSDKYLKSPLQSEKGPQ